MARLIVVLFLVLALAGSAAADDLSDCKEGAGDAAIASCTRVLRSSKLDRRERVRAHNARGILLKKQGDYDRAIADYTSALELDPNYFYALYNRGNSYFDQHDHDRAIADYTAAIRANSKFPQAYNNRGLTFAEKRDFDRAIADFNEAIRLNRKFADAYNNRGVAWRSKGEYDLAIADYDAALKLNPKDSAAHNNRGNWLDDKGDLDGAIAEYGEAIRLDPKYLNGFTNRAFTHERKGAFAEALADLRSALAIDPSKQELSQDIRRIEQKLAKPVAPISTPPKEPPLPSPPAATSPPQRERRVALVIGNGAYANAPPLVNPANDASDIASALRRLDFNVISGNDLDRRGMEAKIREFSRAIENADLSLLYYAGHGLQVAGKNYLVPIDAKIEREGDLSFEAIDVDIVLQQLERGARANLLFLDACRNNPLARNLARVLGIRSATVGVGLASIQGGVGTMIVYATQPNNVALDGEGRNSPFAAALLTHLPDPGVDVSIMLRRVRADVIRATNQNQVPWDHSSLVGEIVLVRQ